MPDPAHRSPTTSSAGGTQQSWVHFPPGHIGCRASTLTFTFTTRVLSFPPPRRWKRGFSASQTTGSQHTSPRPTDRADARRNERKGETEKRLVDGCSHLGRSCGCVSLAPSDLKGVLLATFHCRQKHLFRGRRGYMCVNAIAGQSQGRRDVTCQTLSGPPRPHSSLPRV